MTINPAAVGGAESKRYLAFDGLRGILALAVVIHHYGQMYDVWWMHAAWISVDTFFILSGFVIAHSYGARIEQGMGFVEFARARLLRLYPIYFIGLMIGTIGLIVGSTELPLRDLSAAFTCAVFVLPYFGHVAWPAVGAGHYGSLFPLDDPGWSLFFELFINIAFYVWLVRFRGRHLVPICVVSLAGYLIGTRFVGIHSGWGIENFWGGFCRVSLFFTMGILISRYHKRLPLQPLRRVVVLTLVMLAGFVANKVPINYFLLLIVSPLLVMVASRADIESSKTVQSAAAWLGAISYPIYITHYPLARFSDMLASAIGLSPAPSVRIVTCTILAIALAALLVKVEPYLRRPLTVLTAPKRAY